MRFTAKKGLSIFLSVTLLAVSFATYFVFTPKANAALLTSVSVQLGDPRPSNTSTPYTIKWTFPSTTSIKCIAVSFGNTSAVTPAPTGMTTTSSSGAINGSTTGGLTPGSWTYYNTNNGVLQFENAAGEASTATTIQLDITGITNPSVGTFYAIINTYSAVATHVCSGAVDTSNTMALATTGGVSTSVTVDPTISFSVAGSSGAINGGPTSSAISTASSIAFGNVSAGGSATSAAQILTTSTNAAHGYNIYIRYNQALTDANADTIRDQAGTPGSPNSFDGSTSQSSFAYTTNSSTIALTSNKWAGLTTTNTSIDNQTTPQSATTLSVEYQLQLKNVQPPGTYSNVITYTATPTY